MLLLAAALQWLGGAPAQEPGALGMGAPVQLSWDVGKGSSLLGTTDLRAHPGLPVTVAPAAGAPAATRLLAAPPALLPRGRTLLVQWGKLILEGG